MIGIPNLCPPAIIYLIFSITQILIDSFKGLYNTAFIKFIVMVMITALLNILCQSGLGVISWLIVFIPFILMTVIVTMLLYVFGLNTTTGSLDYACTNTETTNKNNMTSCGMDSNGNIIIYDPDYDPLTNPVYYQAPNIVVPNPNNSISEIKRPPSGSSDPSYQS
jgi:hypothetical protein